MKKTLLYVAIGALALSSCTKEESESPTLTAQSLGTMALSETMHLNRLVQAPGETWNIRMNDLASAAYASGETNYPVHSLMIKEKHNDQGAITGFEIMYKTSEDLVEGNGWMYESLDANGQVVDGIHAKSAACKNCHSADSRISLH